MVGSVSGRDVKPGYIQTLVNAIIRPPRAVYHIESLGPSAFVFCGRRFIRSDISLPRGQTLLQCSYWKAVERVTDRTPVVIYMHGSGSSRVEAVPQLSHLLSLGVAVFAFDFAGSGKSEGDTVSLGYYEREDLASVVAYLRGTDTVSDVALWGRSMGAVTSLLHGYRDSSIACMILDSAFADFTQLAKEIADKGRKQGLFLPKVAVSIVLRMVKSSVLKQANFNIKHASPIVHADQCVIPALFIAAREDTLISPMHSKAIYKRYAGKKNLVIVEGNHNSRRPKSIFDSVSTFIRTHLMIPEECVLDIPSATNIMLPPWQNYDSQKCFTGERNSKKKNKLNILVSRVIIFYVLTLLLNMIFTELPIGQATFSNKLVLTWTPVQLHNYL